jgi:HlyD family secretion protein
VKVYETKLSIEGHHDWVKPGMSAQVEILIKELADVIYIPIQAVVPSDSQKVCYVVRGLGEPEKRTIEVGEFNNEFIEVKSGLSEGDRVLLRAPVVPEEAGKAKEGKDGEKDDKKGKEQKKASKGEKASPPPAEGKP